MTILSLLIIFLLLFARLVNPKNISSLEVDDGIDDISSDLDVEKEPDPILVRISRVIVTAATPKNHVYVLRWALSNPDLSDFRGFFLRIGRLWELILLYTLVTWGMSKMVFIESDDYTLWDLTYRYYTIVKKTVKIGDYNEVPLIIQHVILALNNRGK